MKTESEIAALERDIKALRGEVSLALNQRERDLLLYCRGELHEAGLITDDEYAAGGGGLAARRLEDYDQLRAVISRFRDTDGKAYKKPGPVEAFLIFALFVLGFVDGFLCAFVILKMIGGF